MHDRNLGRGGRGRSCDRFLINAFFPLRHLAVGLCTEIKCAALTDICITAIHSQFLMRSTDSDHAPRQNFDHGKYVIDQSS